MNERKRRRSNNWKEREGTESKEGEKKLRKGKEEENKRVKRLRKGREKKKKNGIDGRKRRRR